MREKRIIPKQNVHDDFKLAPQPVPVPAPTPDLLREQARENVAEPIAIAFYNKEVSESGSNINWEGYKDLYMQMAYPVADQILRLLPFPDEQGIEKRVRKEIGEWIEKNAVVSVESKEVIPNKLSVSQATYGFYTKEWHELLKSLRAGEPPQEVSR